MVLSTSHLLIEDGSCQVYCPPSTSDSNPSSRYPVAR
jgi:hypothetical protein